jgi:hypothetical protein
MLSHADLTATLETFGSDKKLRRRNQPTQENDFEQTQLTSSEQNTPDYA